MNRQKSTGPSSSELENPLFIVEIVRTLLADFQWQLIVEMQPLLHEKKSPPEKQWLKSSEVRKLLSVSHGTLQTLRNNGTIPLEGPSITAIPISRG